MTIALLGACARPGPGPAVPKAPQTARVEAEGVAAFDVEGFHPPFDRVPLSRDFLEAHRVRAVVLHRDADGDPRLVDVDVTTFVYDEEGRLLSETLVDRGVQLSSVRYVYANGRLERELYEHENAKGGWSVSYTYDDAGRVVSMKRETDTGTMLEMRFYDEQGRLVEATQQQRSDKATRHFHYAGDRLVRTVTEVAPGVEHTASFTYDAQGRRTQWVEVNEQGRTDTYDFTYDDAGRLRTQSFTEDDKPIYRRHYRYDEDGRPIEKRLESFVPAMGEGDVIRYAYELHGEPPRETVKSRDAIPTPTELTRAMVDAVPGAYVELAEVTYSSTAIDRFGPESVRVWVPAAALESVTQGELEAAACTVKKSAGYDCDCESITRGEPTTAGWLSWPDKNVVPVTLSFGLGC